jgi:transcriptional regulator with XRE-family HTH domain
MNIGEYVSKARTQRGLTLDDLYSLTNIRPAHLSRLINNPPKNPDVTTVERLATAFNVQPADIWKAITSTAADATPHLQTTIYARVGRHLQHMQADAQERAIRILEQTAQGLAGMVPTNNTPPNPSPRAKKTHNSVLCGRFHRTFDAAPALLRDYKPGNYYPIPAI